MAMATIQNKAQKEKKNEQSTSNLWDSLKWPNIKASQKEKKKKTIN